MLSPVLESRQSLPWLLPAINELCSPQFWNQGKACPVVSSSEIDYALPSFGIKAKLKK